MSFGVFLPYLPQWLEGRGIEGVRFGLIVAMRPLAEFFSPVLFGIVADRFGIRGILMRATCIVAGLSMGGLALLSLLEVPLSFEIVLAGMVLFYFFRAPIMSIADVTTMEGSGSRYGTVRAFGSAGFLVSALTAGYLLDPNKAGTFPTVIAAVLFVAAAVSLLIPPGRVATPNISERRAMKTLLIDTEFRRFLLTACLWLASHAAYDLCLSLHLRDLGATGSTIGWAWTLATIGEATLMAFSGLIFKHFEASAMLSTATSAMVLRWLLIAFVTDYRVLLILQPLHALTFGLFWIAAAEVIRKRASNGTMATAQGLYSGFTALGGGMSMLVWGPLYSTVRGVGVFTTAAVVAGAAILMSLTLPRNRSVRGE